MFRQRHTIDVSVVYGIAVVLAVMSKLFVRPQATAASFTRDMRVVIVLMSLTLL